MVRAGASFLGLPPAFAPRESTAAPSSAQTPVGQTPDTPEVARSNWPRLASLAGLLVLLVVLSACGRLGIGAAQSVDGPRLSFEKQSHDFGEVSASQPTEHRFAFTNTGTRPLEITDVQPAPPRPGG